MEKRRNTEKGDATMTTTSVDCVKCQDLGSYETPKGEFLNCDCTYPAWIPLPAFGMFVRERPICPDLAPMNSDGTVADHPDEVNRAMDCVGCEHMLADINEAMKGTGTTYTMAIFQDVACECEI